MERNGNEQTLPYDVNSIKEILQSMGVTEYEPEIINQLLEFLYSEFES